MTNNNDDIPEFIYGTAWKEDQTSELVRLALENGFRAIDTANQRKHYHEAGVGNAVTEAIDDGLVTRSELFIQTKFTYQSGQDNRLPYDPDDSHDQQVNQSLERSLEHLNTDYVDSLVLHGPQTRSGLTDADKTVWETFEELCETEQVNRIGLSNVTPDQLEEFIEFSSHKPEFVQNRCFARMAWDRPTREICESEGIHYQGFSLLTANQRELQARKIHELAEENDMTVPQLVFCFALELGMIPLTGTTDEQHMKQDRACLDMQLSEDDIDLIEKIAV